MLKRGQGNNFVGARNQKVFGREKKRKMTSATAATAREDIQQHIAATNQSIQKHHEYLKELLRRIQIAHKVRPSSTKGKLLSVETLFFVTSFSLPLSVC
jgi:hypothetical protein